MLTILIMVWTNCGEREFPVYKNKLSPPENNIIIQASGDTMLARGLRRTIKTKGYKYPFQDIKPTIEEADLMFVNLETVITDKGKLRDPKNRINYVSPSYVMDTLLYSGIDAVSIANNHIYDAGSEGISGAMELLQNTNLMYGGAGMNEQQASQPTLVEIKGIKIAILYYTGVGLSFKAGRDKAGYNPMEYTNRNQYINRLSKDLKRVRENNHLVILSIHWGKNFTMDTTQEQIDFAHDALDMGVDILFGHGAHHFHGIEIYKGKPILYDMGDFLNDYSVRDDFANLTFIFKLFIKGNSVNHIKLIPTSSYNRKVVIESGEKADKALEMMKDLSMRFETEMKIDEDIGFIMVNGS
jgi:poly-gamma-glutamate capsule biosynthesis protein CapA/YwtB (metallophosphatase superfamily)